MNETGPIDQPFGTELVQMGLFLAVGLMNTGVDLCFYNLFVGKPFRLTRIRANLLSTTIAMSFSFTANLFFVFTPRENILTERTLKFLLVTMFSLYVLQSCVIFLASKACPVPVRAAVGFLRRFRSTASLSEDFVQRNVAKLIATIASLIWNFAWYKFYVYAN